jgi:hypothetical protein
VKYFLVLFLFFQGVTFAQTAIDTLPPPITASKAGIPSNTPTLEQGKIDWNRFGVATGILAASITGLHFLQKSWWADSDRTAFHITDDPGYEKNFDKFGHAFGGYYTCHFFYEAYSWSGMDNSQATLLAGISGALYEFYVEIEDGFGKSWGFSPGDAKADLAGAAFFVLRNKIDFLKNFQYKWLFYPSGDTLYFQNHSSYNPIDDYEGQSYWFTADIHRMLPESAKEYWPKWLNLAFGIGGMNLESFDNNSPTGNVYDKREKAYYIGLDFDLEKIIPESDIGIINFIRRGLSYWHFPAPAYRISPDPRFFILFPFRMTIGSHAH